MFDLGNAGDLVDLGIAGDPVYCDGVAELENLGQTFQTTYFCWMKPNGIWLRVARLHVVRPRTSCLPGSRFNSILSEMEGPRMPMVSLAH
jgi:hypothetical protein